jgi:hypothetical protein
VRGTIDAVQPVAADTFACIDNVKKDALLLESCSHSQPDRTSTDHDMTFLGATTPAQTTSPFAAFKRRF